ncbi:MAG: glutaminase [Crocosphaera sp.]
MMTNSPILNCINYIHERYNDIRTGQVATYIPELAKANPNFFGICITTPDGQTYEVGESQHSFTIQSQFSKVYEHMSRFNYLFIYLLAAP